MEEGQIGGGVSFSEPPRGGGYLLLYIEYEMKIGCKET